MTVEAVEELCGWRAGERTDIHDRRQHPHGEYSYKRMVAERTKKIELVHHTDTICPDVDSLPLFVEESLGRYYRTRIASRTVDRLIDRSDDGGGRVRDINGGSRSNQQLSNTLFVVVITG